MKTDMKNYVLTGSESRGYVIHENNHVEAFIATDVKPREMAVFLRDHANSGMPALQEREWKAIVSALDAAVARRITERWGTDLSQLAENIQNTLDEVYPKDLATLISEESPVVEATMPEVKVQTVPTYFGALEVGDEFFDLKENHFLVLKCHATVDFKQHNCVCVGKGDLKGQVRFKKDDEYVLKIIA